jgi:GAF domain-containing protein
MAVLSRASEFLASPVGGFVYHLVLLLAVEAALAMVIREWRRDRREQTQRLLITMAGLTVVRAAYVVVALFTWARWLSPEALLPPLERFVDIASIALLGWAFAPAGKRGGRIWTLTFGANLVVAVGVLVTFTVLWSQTLSGGVAPDYAAHSQATVWAAWQLGLLLLACLAVLRNQRETWGIPFVAMVVMLLGSTMQLVWPTVVPSLPVWVRLSNLVAYPLITIAVYQYFVTTTYVHVRNVEDISQASLDEIKSLLLLSEASRQVSGSLRLSEVLDRAAQGTARALDADQCAIAFPMEDDPGHMRLEAVHNPTRQGRGESVTFPLDFQLAVQQAMRRKKYVIVEEMDNVQVKVLFSLMGSGESGPMLVQPMLLDGEAIGAMIVGNSHSLRQFTPHEAKLCQSMAEHVVGAIQNAWKYQEAQDKIRDLERSLDIEHGLAEQDTGQTQELDEPLIRLESGPGEPNLDEQALPEPSVNVASQVVSARADADQSPVEPALPDTEMVQSHSDSPPRLRWYEEPLAHRTIE